MRAHSALALLVALAVSSLAVPPFASPQETLERELVLSAAGEPLEERGPFEVIDFEPTVSGTLVVWASSAELDPFLRIERADGTVLGADDDSGGGTTAFLGAPVRAGEALFLLVAATRPGSAGRVRVSLRTLAETDATRAACASARAAIGAAHTSLEAGEPRRSDEILTNAVAEFLATDGVLASAEGLRTLPLFVEPACYVSNGVLALSVAAAADRALTALYPPGCGPALLARRAHAGMEFTYGDAEQGLDLQSAVVQGRRELRGGDPFELGLDEATLGQAYYETGAYEPAADWLASGLGRMAPLRRADDAVLVNCKAAYGKVLVELGDPERGRSLLEEAVDGATQRYGAAHSITLLHQGSLAYALHALGDFEGALAAYRRVLAGQIELCGPEHALVAQTRMNVGICSYQLGETSAALDELQRAEAIFDALGDRSEDRGIASRVLASVALERGELEQARVTLEHARVAELPPCCAWPLDELESRLESALGRPAEALRLAEHGLGLVRDALPGEALGEVQLLVRASDGERGLGDTERAEALAIRASLALAAELRRTSLALSSREAAALGTARAALVSEVLARLPSGSGAADEAALALVEAARGLSSTAATTAHRLALAPEAEALERTRRDVRRWTRAIARLAHDDDADALRRAVDEKERAERELRTLGRPGGDEADEPRAYASSAIAAALPADTCAIGYWRYDPIDVAHPSDPPAARLVAFVVRPDAPLARIELGACAPIRAALERWRAEVASGASASDGQAAGAELRAALIDPLRASIGRATRWLIAPNDALYALAFDALPEERGVLGERVRVVVVPSLADLVRPPAASPTAPHLLTIGGLDYGALDAEPSEGAAEAPRPVAGQLAAALRAAGPSAGFQPLPGSGEEVVAVAQRFRERFDEGGTLVALDGRRATRAAVERELERASHVHLATHGFFLAADEELEREDRPAPEPWVELDVLQPVQVYTALARCGLALSGASLPPGPDGELPGVLSAEELSGLDLSRCELVVLSACDTSRGYLRAGQGVASFQQALHAAGARCVITSLWTVDDERTRELMVAFYRGLWERGLTPEEALWQAKADLRAHRASPRDWAGWVLSRSGG